MIIQGALEKTQMPIAVQCERCHSLYRVNSALAGQDVFCLNCGFPVHVPIHRQPSSEAPPAQARQVEPHLPADAPAVPRQIIPEDHPAALTPTAPNTAPAIAPPPLPRRHTRRSGIPGAPPPPLPEGPDLRFMEDRDRFAISTADPDGSSIGTSSGTGFGTSAGSTAGSSTTRALSAHGSSDSTIAELPPLEGLIAAIPAHHDRPRAWPYGPGQWKPADTFAIHLVLCGLTLCLLPIFTAAAWEPIQRSASILLNTGLALAFTGSAILAIKQRFAIGAVAASFGFFAFVVGTAQHTPAPNPISQAAAPTPTAPTGPTAPDSASPTSPAPDPDKPAMPPALVGDPVDTHLTHIHDDDPALRAKSMRWLVNNAPPTRFEQISRAFEPRLGDPDPTLRLVALRGLDLHRDERSLLALLTALGNNPTPEFKAEIFHLLLDRKDPASLLALVPRLAEDYAQVHAILAAIAANPLHRGQVTAALEPILSSSNARLRELAIEELALYPGTATVPALIPLVADREVAVRHAAMRTLGKLKDPRAVDPLIARLRDDRDAASAALQAIGAPAEKALVALLRGSDRKTRESAITLLKTIATSDSLEALRAAALDDDYVVASAALEAWKRLDPDGVTPVLTCAIDLESPDPLRWRAGLDRLAKAKIDRRYAERLSPRLLFCALHDEPTLRAGAVPLLPDWSDGTVVPELVKVLDLRTKAELRQRAHAALAVMRDPRGAAAVARFVTVDSPDAFNALRAMGIVAQDELLRLLEHRDPQIRASAVSLLGDVGDVQAIPALHKLAMLEAALKADCQAAITSIRKRLPR